MFAWIVYIRLLKRINLGLYAKACTEMDEWQFYEFAGKSNCVEESE